MSFGVTPAQERRVVCEGPPQRGRQGRSNHVFRPGISFTGKMPVLLTGKMPVLPARVGGGWADSPQRGLGGLAGSEDDRHAQ